VAERWRGDAHAILAAALRDETGEVLAAAAARLVAALAQAGGRLSRRDAQRRLRYTATQLDGAVRAGGARVRERRETTGGRPAEWLELVAQQSPEPAEGRPASVGEDDLADGDEAGGTAGVTDVTKGTKASSQEGGPPPLVTAGVTKAAEWAADAPTVTADTARANGHPGRGAAVEVVEL
jgi:hypothetical protein